nr:ribonuclease HI [Candidatus Chloroploca sp. Khr17]
MSEDLKQVTIYTDGACEPNPGPGGYGVVLIYGDNRKELSGGFCYTTNNRMEIMAVIKALEALKKPCIVMLYTDSRYVVDTMSLGWAKRWKANNWMRSKKERAVNVDLWNRLLELSEQHHVEFRWVKGHAGNQENERCDKLSCAALIQADLPVDEGFEQRTENTNKIHKNTSVKAEKMTRAGQACRKCGTPVVKQVPRKQPKATQSYYFEYYLYCPSCHAMYMVEDAKRFFDTLPLD